tara:strand:+ start:412 stop:627 length:216 start_codon:yes stop_codon:yes gene_type:complete
MLICIKKEIINRVRYLQKKNITSIYFGGGTPSILEVFEIKELLQLIKKNYSVTENAEITLECNPEDLNKKN